MFTLPPPPLADIFDAIMGLLPFILMLLYVAAQLFTKENKAGRPRPSRPQRPRPPQPRADAAPPGMDPADEVEEFLRRVAERRAGRPAAEVEVAPAPEPPRRIAEPVSRPVPGAPKPRRVERPARPKQPMGDAPRTPAHPPPPPEHESIAAEIVEDAKDRKERFRDHFEDESAVSHADEAMDSHIHAVFDHKISSLTSMLPHAGDVASHLTSSGQRRSAGSPAAAGLIELINSPHDLRRAIILHEIFDRREDRW